ncbi:MAG: hypothetical protein P4N41_02105 [Negativicutes bacterium]|nr:hypothetical protein [Negativicutes bacterium]
MSAVQWDTSSNKVYFNVEKGSLEGRLIVRKTSDGKIGMHIAKSEASPGGHR